MPGSFLADVIVIGSGQAGVPLAVRLAQAGKRVLIVERGLAGGTCVNNGCTPTKTMIASARAAHVARSAGRLGITVHDVQVDLPAIVARKDAMVTRWRQGVEHRLVSAGENLRFVRGHARFVAPRTIDVAGERHHADKVVINVGGRPALPAIDGLEKVAHLTSTDILNLRVLPRHLVILGGGYIGCEMGQMFRRFGAAVTIVQSQPRLLPHEDQDVSQSLEDVFRTEGLTLALGKRAHEITAADSGGEVTVTVRDVARGREIAGASVPTGVSQQQLRASHVLVATGRRPNTDDLGCQAGEVELDDDGYVSVDEHYQTSAAGVFAVGDCTPGPQFTHVAWDDHRVLFDILAGRPARARGERVVPYAVFTDPQVAGVGLSEGQARERGIAVEVARMPFGNIARAIETDELAGLVKVLIDSRSDRVVGARIVGVDAGELIHIFSALMQSNASASARAIVDGEFVHPTFAEGLQTALMKLPRYALTSA